MHGMDQYHINSACSACGASNTAGSSVIDVAYHEHDIAALKNCDKGPHMHLTCGMARFSGRTNH